MTAVSKKTVLQVLILALALGTSLFVLQSTEAANPDDPYEIEYRWLLTDEAIARTALGEDCQDPNFSVCREECLIDPVTGEESSTGRFRCFAF